jgi:hypothetical protein
MLFWRLNAAANIFFVLYGCGSGGLKPPLIYSVDFSGGFLPPQMFWNQPILNHFRRKKAAAKCSPQISGGFLTQKAAAKFATSVYPAASKTAANTLFWPFF